MKILSKTQSICPFCHKPLTAAYVLKDGKVFLRKTCAEHGDFESNVADHEEDFLKWTSNPVVNIPPRKAITKGMDMIKQEEGSLGACPLHCGTCENHLQTACCVLVEVTQRCNQHCPYCFAKAEKDECDEPSLSEIERKYDLLLELGEERTFNIQLSGGEPTVRQDLPEIIKMGRNKGFEFIQINTNGRRLAQEEGYAQKLKDAGASVVFLQFDGTDDAIYKTLRGEPLFELKKRAVENCRKAGIPVTIVPMVARDVNLENIGAMMEFLLENVDVVKGIHFQPVSFFGRYPDRRSKDGTKYVDYENRVTMFDIMNALENQTNGAFRFEHFYPITSGHPLCCFQSSYQKQRDGTVKSLINYETKTAGLSCCEAKNPLEIIKKDRDFVRNKWNVADPDRECSCNQQEEAPCSCGGGKEPAKSIKKEEPAACCCDNDTMDFDQFLWEIRNNMFSVSCMPFMDISNLDAERLKRCRVQVLSPDDRLIPFCAYNSIYRK